MRELSKSLFVKQESVDVGKEKNGTIFRVKLNIGNGHGIIQILNSEKKNCRLIFKSDRNFFRREVFFEAPVLSRLGRLPLNIHGKKTDGPPMVIMSLERAQKKQKVDHSNGRWPLS
ncbi:MAG: hypothetical protein WC575_04895 [Patescibacteria group bacterium]